MMRTSSIWSLCAAAALLLAGCKVELYRAVPEREANLMVAILFNHDIEALKEESSEEGLYALWVEESEFSHAVELLVSQGYPRRHHPTLAQLFQPSGLVPTPFEEQVRYIYGLSEELSHTISLFDGVIETRVHVALQEEQQGKGNKISIYIKYDQGADFDSLVPRVKKLASDSVRNINYDDVEILAIPAYLRTSENKFTAAYKFPGGIRVLPEYYGLFLTLMIAIFLILLQAIGAAAWFYWLWHSAVKKQSDDQAAAAAALPIEAAPQQAANPEESV